MAEDYYKTLGISRNASQADIQKAYRELARKYHPDLNPDDATARKRFQEVQTAFDVLNDPEKREMYDRYGHSFESGAASQPHGAWRAGPAGAGGGSPFGGFQAEFTGDDFDFAQFFGERFGGGGGGAAGFGDIFGQFRQAEAGQAGRAASGRQRRRGADIAHELRIPFTTSITGGEAQIAVRRESGKVETISVKIPPGIEDGKKIRLRGQGEPGPRGGNPGDLLLTVRVSPHACFKRQGNNLLVRVPVTLAEAALGAKVDVPTPQGTVSLRVPAETSSGTKLRLKDRGVAVPNGSKGDLLAEIEIVLPEKLDDESRDLIRKLDEQNPMDPRTNLRW
jgi:DnaJ-class molecular chaperone